jgi:hypothetical protein
MADISEMNEEQYQALLERIIALCKGFLLVADQSRDKACSFCRGLLILLQQLLEAMPDSEKA